MQQPDPQSQALDYATPASETAHSGLGIASVVVAMLTALPFYLICAAAIDWHKQPSFYVHPLVFSLMVLPALVGVGLGVVLGAVGLRNKQRRRAAAFWGLGLNGLMLAGLTVLMVITNGGTRSP
jgi:hypothetical protein